MIIVYKKLKINDVKQVIFWVLKHYKSIVKLFLIYNLLIINYSTYTDN